MKPYSLLLILMILVFGCKKKKTPPPEPTIEIIEVSPMNITEFTDSVIIRLKYADNNGDIGDESPDELSLQIKDSRLANPDWQHIKPLAPIGSNVKIEGELRIKLNSMFVLGNGNSETATLTIKLKDQEGNWSNEVTSSPITIHK